MRLEFPMCGMRQEAALQGIRRPVGLLSQKLGTNSHCAKGRSRQIAPALPSPSWYWAGSQDHRLLSSPVPPHSAGFFCLGPVTGPRASPLWQGNGRGRGEVCKPNCKPTTRHRPVSGNTSQHRWPRNAKRKHTLSYKAIQASMRIIELENRCTGNRTVGSNPTLSAMPY